MRVSTNSLERDTRATLSPSWLLAEKSADRWLGLAELGQEPGEHQQAFALLDEVGDLFSRHGAKFYIDQVIVKEEILKA